MERRLKARDILFGCFATTGVEVCDDARSSCTHTMNTRQGIKYVGAVLILCAKCITPHYTTPHHTTHCA